MSLIPSNSRIIKLFALPIAGVCTLWLAGCGESASTSPEVISDPPPDTAAHAEHNHPSEGPHHGDLVELGNEEFHVEVVHGEAGSVTAYILNSTAKVAVPIDAADLAINISHDGKAEQFKLLADREASDPEGKSSRFSIKDEELAKDLDDHDSVAKLVVMIEGKSYSGKIAHNHDAEHTHDDGHKH